MWYWIKESAHNVETTVMVTDTTHVNCGLGNLM